MEKISLPRKIKLKDDIEKVLVRGIYGFNIKDRISFPKYTELSFFEENYDDIKLEYLITFLKNESDGREVMYALMPEYRTFIREYCFESYSDKTNLDFYYCEDILSYSSPERENIVSAKMFGVCTVNPTDHMDAFRQLSDCLYESLCNFKKEVLLYDYRKNINVKIEYNVDAKLYINNILVGYVINESEKGFISGHLNIDDIVKALLKN